MVRENGPEDFTRTFDSTGSPTSQLTVNSTLMFNFSRISANNGVPVMSRVVISPVSNSLNGTVMKCVDTDTAEVPSTTIIIGIGERGALQGEFYLIIHNSCHTLGSYYSGYLDGHVLIVIIVL